MTNEQIDYVMNEVGGPAAGEYFDLCGKWTKANWENLKALHKAFESDAKSEIDLSVFCSRMYNETEEGIAAADRLLLPILNRN